MTSKKFYWLHREELLEKSKQHKLKNKEYYKKYNKEYRLKNLDKLRAYDKDHKELFNKRKREYNQTPLGIYVRLKIGARTRSLPFELEKDKFEEWYISQLTKQKHSCYYCDIPFSLARKDEWKMYAPKRATYSGRPSVDRMDSFKGYTWNNIVLACSICQFTKRNIFNAVTWRKMAQIGVKTLWKKIFNKKE